MFTDKVFTLMLHVVKKLDLDVDKIRLQISFNSFHRLTCMTVYYT